MPSRASARVESRPIQRRALAVLACPASRRRPMARLLKLAIALGPLPVRTWLLSSPLSRYRDNGDYAEQTIMPRSRWAASLSLLTGLSAGDSRHNRDGLARLPLLDR